MISSLKWASLETNGFPAIILGIWENPSAQFVSWETVWAANVQVVGSSPTGGIFRPDVSMCNFTYNFILAGICASFWPVAERGPGK